MDDESVTQGAELQWSHAWLRMEIDFARVLERLTNQLQWSHAWLRMEIAHGLVREVIDNALQWSHAWLRMEIRSGEQAQTQQTTRFNGAMRGYAWK